MKTILSTLGTLFILLLTTTAQAQQYITFGPYESQCTGNPFSYGAEMQISGIKVNSIYSDDGNYGTFSYEVYVSIKNIFNGNFPTNSPNFWTFQLSLNTTNNNARNISNSFSVPIQNTQISGLAFGNNPTYTGSASKMGLVANTYYTDQSIIQLFGYTTGTLFVNMSCLQATKSGTVTNNYVPVFITPEPLPIELISFSAYALSNNTNNIQWKTASEKNVRSFEIEKSANAIDWEAAASIVPSSKGGISTEINTYSWNDATPLSGTTHYRLKTVDLDGTISYSKVVTTTNKIATAVSIFPNPAQDKITIQGVEIGATIQLTNLQGQTLQHTIAQQTTTTLQVDQLQPGLYLVAITTTNDEQNVYKIVVQK